MRPVQQTYRRIAIFTATETHIEAAPGEWLRDDEHSTAKLSEIANSELERMNVTPLSVSAPNVQMVSQSADGKRRTFTISISVIYKPLEVIDGDEGAQDVGGGISNVGQVVSQLASQLNQHVVNSGKTARG